MGSTFSTYNIATSGLYNGQAALTTISTNLSNVNTTGYSRQRVISTEQNVVLSSTSSYGSGVSIDSIERVRNSFLDKTYRSANASTEYWDAKDSMLEDAQSLLNEYDASDSTSDDSNGLQTTIQDFFDAWDDLANDPSSQSTRKALVESATALVDTMSDLDSELSEIQTNAGDRLKNGVDQVNTLAQQVAALNGQITATTIGGNTANDLEDARDDLIDQISALTNVSVTAQDDGSVNLYIGGVSLVQGVTARSLTTVTDDATHQLTVQWSGLNTQANITDGSLKAYLEEADTSAVSAISTTSTYDFTTSGASCIANLRQGLNDLLISIATQVNSLLESGTDLEGSQGIALFVPADSSSAFMVGNITVNSAITEDVDKLAAGTTGGSEDNTIALKINKLQDEAILQADGLSMDTMDFYQTLISWISTTGDAIDSNYDTQNTLLQQANTQRQETAAVSQDEELSKMITYQSAYNASARVLNTIDALIAGLIDDLGG